MNLMIEAKVIKIKIHLKEIIKKGQDLEARQDLEILEYQEDQKELKDLDQILQDMRKRIIENRKINIDQYLIQDRLHPHTDLG